MFNFIVKFTWIPRFNDVDRNTRSIRRLREACFGLGSSYYRPGRPAAAKASRPTINLLRSIVDLIASINFAASVLFTQLPSTRLFSSLPAPIFILERGPDPIEGSAPSGINAPILSETNISTTCIPSLTLTTISLSSGKNGPQIETSRTKTLAESRLPHLQIPRPVSP